MGLFLGVDMGTSYFKAALFNDKGELKGFGRKPLCKSTPNENQYELAVPVFLSTLKECIIEAIEMAAANPCDIQAMSYSSQANSFVLLDEKNNPLTPIILWIDERVKELNASLQELSNRNDFTFTTGIGSWLSPQMCVAKLIWFQKNKPPLWQRVKKIMTISDYLTFLLTNESLTDYSTTSLTGLLDLQKGCWWDEALAAVNMPPSFLATPARTGTLIGSITNEGADKFGLSAGTKFTLGGLDHHLAAIGAGLCQSNNISESTGTVLASVNYSNYYEPKKNVFTSSGLDNEHFFQLTYNENGARNLEWYKENFAPEFSIAELIEKATSVKDGSEGLIAKPCVSKYDSLNGFLNRNPFHKHGHFIRAILESTAFSLKELIDVLSPKSYDRVVSTGGGAMSSLWVQIKADMLGKEFFISQSNENACLGAAMIAATSIRYFSTVKEASIEWIKTKQIFKPNPDNFHFYHNWMQPIKQKSAVC